MTKFVARDWDVPENVLGPITSDVVEGGGSEAYASSWLGSEWLRRREEESYAIGRRQYQIRSTVHAKIIRYDGNGDLIRLLMRCVPFFWSYPTC